MVMELHLKKLLDQVKNAIWLKHYAYCSEKIYVQWIRRYILGSTTRQVFGTVGLPVNVIAKAE